MGRELGKGGGVRGVVGVGVEVGSEVGVGGEGGGGIMGEEED